MFIKFTPFLTNVNTLENFNINWLQADLYANIIQYFLFLLIEHYY